ncbi:hypothetical protein VTK73DRAFT_2542 [Phialemonium thermophilum]|uniref:Alcohol dehydrogenase n=1 Tax=Phialemonium thermophilum TaxID=223376 RepID=A0ABR3VS04_9PEZI
MGGIVSIIGFLGGTKPDVTALDALNHLCTFRGVYVGSRQMMEDMVRAVEANHIKPVVDDRVFSLDQVREAYDYMWAQSHFGKLTIDLD